MYMYMYILALRKTGEFKQTYRQDAESEIAEYDPYGDDVPETVGVAADGSLEACLWVLIQIDVWSCACPFPRDWLIQTERSEHKESMKVCVF